MAYGEIPAAGSLVEYWKFNGDSTGASHSTILALTSTTFTSAKFGSAGLNTGTVGRGAISNAMSIPSNNIRTYSFWIKIASLPPNSGNQRGFFFFNASSSAQIQWDFLYNYNSGNYQLAARHVVSGVAIDQVLYVTTLSTSKWYHMVVTCDGANMYLYINAVPQGGSAAVTGGGGSGATDIMYVGANGGVDPQPGIYDDFIIDSVYWTPQKIKRYYDQAVGRLTPVIV